MVARWLRRITRTTNPQLDRRKTVEDIFEHVASGVRLTRRPERRIAERRQAQQLPPDLHGLSPETA